MGTKQRGEMIHNASFDPIFFPWEGNQHDTDKKDLQNLAPILCPSHRLGPCRL
jgi:hypothetical protein